ncbi:MAG: DUF4234 domain-containing protein [Candidatus Zixiibacteriota bacterium]
MNPPVKYRNMFLQVLLMIVTLGFYSVYWFHETATEMKNINNDPQANPLLWTILLFVPFAGLYSYYKYSEQYEKITNSEFNRWLLFVFWLFLPFVVWIIVQVDLNKRAQAVVVPAQ